MKTRQYTWTVRWGLLTALAISAGCGSPPAATGNEGGDPPTASAPTTTNAAPASEDTLEGVVKRAERVARALPKDVAKVVDLVQSGVGEEVVRAYVATSPEPYRLDLDDVLYLRDIGVPDGVVAGMLRRGNELQEQAAAAANVQTNFVAAVQEIKDAIATEVVAEVRANGAALADASPMPADVPPTESDSGASPVPVASTSPPPQAPAEVQQFYSDLAPYGSWYEVPTYGWVWQPAVVTVNSGWAPYCHGGRWIWSNYGWYWASDYSWGWAPFHYGRWATYPGLGWCWTPGAVWGPSWVTWSYTGGCVGWAPLPPACGWSAGIGLTWYGSGVAVGFGFGLASSCYTYVPYGNFCHRNVGHYRLPPDQAHSVHGNATVINNVINGDNNTIINSGIGYETIASRTRSEVPKARVEPLPAQADRNLRVDRLERGKDGNVVYKPTPIESPGATRTALRSEVGPATSRPATTTASLASAPSRPGIGSRFAGDATASASKPMETRSGIPASAQPKAIEGRNSASRPIAGTSALNSPASAYVPSAGSRGAVQSQASPSTAPASRGLATSTRVLSSTAPTAKPAVEARSATASSAVSAVPSARPQTATPSSVSSYPTRSTTTYARPATATTAPASVPKTVEPARTSPYNVPARPNYSAPASASGTPRATYTAPSAAGSTPRTTYSIPNRVMSAPRATATTPSPMMTAPRATYTVPQSTMSAPRATYTAPRPAVSPPAPSYSAPAMSAPRATYSAPSPAMSRPSPTFSAPAPAMSAPRATYTAPVQAGPAPSAGARGGGSRGRMN